MASHDLEIIKKIEKTGKWLHRVDELLYNRCYVADEQDLVTALSLRTASLSNASFLKIKELLKELAQLQILDLGNNKLSDISSLKELVRLQSLCLGNNHLKDISFLKELVNLQTLNLSGNQISDISSLKELTQLQSLYLSNNKISDVSSIKDLVHLQTLALSNNHLSDVSSLKDLVQLQRIDLSNNHLSDIFFLKELVQLKVLLLDNNQISDISFLKELVQLQRIDLRSNQISSLPQWITELPLETVFSDDFEFYKINVFGNPLTHPPPEIIKQGREAIRAYFRSFEKDEAVTLHECKVLLVGDGKAGKTSLLKQFQGLKFDEQESQTHGINVLSIDGRELPGFVPPAEDCRLHFWDFGGQEIMHASHSFFMSSRSLYILVLDCRDDTSRCHWTWLRHIEKHGGASPVIVAMNKTDINPSFNLQQKEINDRFPWIGNRFFRISCKKDREGLPELLRSMADSVPKTPLYGMQISATWMKIRKRLEEATKEQNYINQEQFNTICKEHGVEDEQSRISLLKLFNDLGTVLYFEQIKLADIYVLDPHWVTVGVYKIINSSRTKDGILREEDLDFILKQEDIRADEYDPAKEKCFIYTVREQAYLVRIMEEFELCYRYDRHQHILPNQLPKEPKEEPALNGENLLRFIMDYDYLPSSLFSRLMVRLKEDICQERWQQWRYGMYLKSKTFGVQAIIKMQEQTNRITITVQGGLHNKREYLSAIRHTIDSLGFKELEPKELVPLPKHQKDDLEYLVEYQELLGYERAGRDEYFHGKSGRAFSVSELLDSVVSKEERTKEECIVINVQNNANQTQHNTNTQTNSQQQSQHQQQSVDVLNQLKEAQGLFRNLKEDILAEAEIELDDEKEKKRVQNELKKAEDALAEAESAAKKGEKPDAAAKSRLEEFFASLADKGSRLGKVLEFVANGAGKAQELARTYNKVAENIGLPSVPTLLLGKEKG